MDGIVQKLWPDHCVQQSKGAELWPSLLRTPSDETVQKGITSNVDSYSAFWDNSRKLNTGLADKLRQAKVWCGQATVFDGGG